MIKIVIFIYSTKYNNQMEYRGKLWKAVMLALGLTTTSQAEYREPSFQYAESSSYSSSAEPVYEAEQARSQRRRTERARKPDKQKLQKPASRRPQTQKATPPKPRSAKEQYGHDIDSELEAKIDSYIKELKRTGYLSSTDDTSFVVYDIDHNRKLASINEDQAMIAASTQKVYPMLAFEHQVNEGKLWQTPLDSWRLRRSIQASDNSATNAIMRRVAKSLGMQEDRGPQAVQAILDRYYPYFNETRFVEFIPDSGRNAGRTYRNKTSTHDLNIFWNQLWRQNLPRSQQMQQLLELKKRDRIYDDTCIPDGVRHFNKTGTVYGQVSDSGIIVMPGNNSAHHPYTVIAIVEDKTKTNPRNRKESFESWRDKRAEVIRRVSEGVYDALYKMHTGKNYVCRKHNGRHLRGRQ